MCYAEHAIHTENNIKKKFITGEDEQCAECNYTNYGQNGNTSLAATLLWFCCSGMLKLRANKPKNTLRLHPKNSNGLTTSMYAHPCYTSMVKGVTQNSGNS